MAATVGTGNSEAGKRMTLNRAFVNVVAFEVEISPVMLSVEPDV
jgi:hypothetical protein